MVPTSKSETIVKVCVPECSRVTALCRVPTDIGAQFKKKPRSIRDSEHEIGDIEFQNLASRLKFRSAMLPCVAFDVRTSLDNEIEIVHYQALASGRSAMMRATSSVSAAKLTLSGNRRPVKDRACKQSCRR